MKIIIALACLLALVSAKPYSSADDAEWENYKETYGKDYGGSGSELDSVRKAIWFRTRNEVRAHNKLYEKGQTSYTMAVNKFADHLLEELGKLRGYKGNQEPQGEIYKPLNGSLPDTVDWRKKNVVTAVKNQGQCGSCWAFSSTGSLEGQWALKKKKLISLSEQQLVDCSRKFGNDGCNGGWMTDSFKYIKAIGGIETEAAYPYTAEDDICKFNKTDIVASDSGFKSIKSGSEADLQDAAANIGPISVAIDASSNAFNYYQGGVFDHPACSSTDLDHGVLVVGYGSENGKDYWLVKNSWGAEWGEHGYIKMSRNKNNQCGIASKASYPLV